MNKKKRYERALLYTIHKLNANDMINDLTYFKTIFIHLFAYNLNYELPFIFIIKDLCESRCKMRFKGILDSIYHYINLKSYNFS